ncbi:stromelysin-2-like [Brachionichthys hirsutus]|uniref:stromelysin-2-like n=1 Tax=Brachionichthys hirsutus TaxID=412623 RepID=UPI0036052C38
MRATLLSCRVVVLLLTSTEPQVDLKLATVIYLQRYYNQQQEPVVCLKRSSPPFTSNVKDMQMFFGRRATGELDSDTLEVMRSARCGVPDVEEYSHIQRTRWDTNVITYSAKFPLFKFIKWHKTNNNSKLQRLLVFLISGFINFFVGPQTYKYDYAQKRVVGVERAYAWLGC